MKGLAGPFHIYHTRLPKLYIVVAMEKLLGAGAPLVKSKSCLFINPNWKEVKARVIWVVFDVSLGVIRNYSKPLVGLKESPPQKRKLECLVQTDSTIVAVRIVLRKDVGQESLPHQLHLFKGTVLVAISLARTGVPRSTYRGTVKFQGVSTLDTLGTRLKVALSHMPQPWQPR